MRYLGAIVLLFVLSAPAAAQLSWSDSWTLEQIQSELQYANHLRVLDSIGHRGDCNQTYYNAGLYSTNYYPSPQWMANMHDEVDRARAQRKRNNYNRILWERNKKIRDEQRIKSYHIKQGIKRAEAQRRISARRLKQARIREELLKKEE